MNTGYDIKTCDKLNKLKNLLGYIHDRVNQEYKDKLMKHGMEGEKLNQVLKNIGLHQSTTDNDNEFNQTFSQKLDKIED